jgi:hypothetical protein
LAGRERTGGGGGPDEAPGAVPPEGKVETGRAGAGGGPLGTTGAGAGVPPGRGGENDGRGGMAAGGDPGKPGPWPLGFCLSFMFRNLATLSKT